MFIYFSVFIGVHCVRIVKSMSQLAERVVRESLGGIFNTKTKPAEGLNMIRCQNRKVLHANNLEAFPMA